MNFPHMSAIQHLSERSLEVSSAHALIEKERSSVHATTANGPNKPALPNTFVFKMKVLCARDNSLRWTSLARCNQHSLQMASYS